MALPRACGDAALVAAYATLKCEVWFEGICWSGSRLTPVQRCLSREYPKVDFDFWATYGSWSKCESCGSFFFNDAYFREAVYEVRRTSSQLSLLCVSRRTLPDDPCEHSLGVVGQGSRWWYIPGMCRPFCVIWSLHAIRFWSSRCFWFAVGGHSCQRGAAPWGVLQRRGPRAAAVCHSARR